MSTFDPRLGTAPSHAAVAAPRRPVGPALRLLAVVALASAASGGLAALAVEHLLASMEASRQAPASLAPLPPAAQSTPPWPAVHDVLRDGVEPLIEPPPVS